MITTQGHAHILSSPYRGSQRGSEGRETSIILLTKNTETIW